jgi:hypothetical protein
VVLHRRTPGGRGRGARAGERGPGLGVGRLGRGRRVYGSTRTQPERHGALRVVDTDHPTIGVDAGVGRLPATSRTGSGRLSPAECASPWSTPRSR